MAGIDALRERFAERFDGVAQMQGSEWRRGLEPAICHPVDRMAPRTMGKRIRLAALFRRRGSQGRCQGKQRNEALAKDESQHC